MRLGLIARCDSRGLGIQSHEAYRHLHPVKTLVVNCPSAKPLPLHPERFPGAMVIDRIPTDEDCKQFLAGLDVVLTFETPYNHNLFSIAREMGVKTVLQYNFEFLAHLQHPDWPQPDLFAAPSTWRFDDVPFANKALLPVPIATDRFTKHRDSVNSGIRRFLHVVGRPAVADRNGTCDLLQALQYVTSEIVVTVKCQEPGYVSGLVPGLTTPDNVTLIVDSGDVLEYQDLYTGHDVLVMPRRFGGLCLPVNEALGAGMPVIMPCIEPNLDWLPYLWLVDDVDVKSSLMTKARIDVYETNPRALAYTIDEFSTNHEFFADAREHALALADSLSWDALEPMYDKVFTELCSVSA